MTAVTDAIKVLEGLARKTLTNEQMVNIVDNFIYSYSDVADETYPVVGVSTAEEKAQFFLDKVGDSVRHQVKRGAMHKFDVDNATLQQSAVDSAIADM